MTLQELTGQLQALCYEGYSGYEARLVAEPEAENRDLSVEVRESYGTGETAIIIRGGLDRSFLI